jgi:hypothetical protein
VGFCMSWIAIRGKSKTELLSELCLIDTSESDPANESPISGTEFNSGWFLLVLNEIEHPYIGEEFLAALSRECEAVGAQVFEGIMYSSSFFYRNGNREWKITHHPEDGVEGIEAEGVLPAEFELIRSDLEKRQKEAGDAEGVDYIFDVPLKMAENICGYAHDQWEFDGRSPDFTRLEAAG